MKTYQNYFFSYRSVSYLNNKKLFLVLFSRDCSALSPNLRLFSFDGWDEVLIERALVCMFTHWIEFTMNHDLRLLGYHDSLNYHTTWTLNFEKILNLC